MRFTKTTYKALILSIAMVSCSTTLFAQPSGGRGGGFMTRITAGGTTPDYMLRDLRRFQETLTLDEEQTMIVEQILRDYDESFRDASTASEDGIRGTFSNMRGNEDDPARQESQKQRERMREIREKMDSARQLKGEEGMQELQERLNVEMEEIRKQMNESRAAQWESPERQAAMEELELYVTDQLQIKKKMRTEFETDLVAVLNEDQLLMWPPLKRMLIRDRLLPKGRLSGETLDVMSLVEQQEFDDATLTKLLPSINDWDLNVTLALQARDDHLVENQGAIMASFRSTDTSSDGVMKEQARLSETVRQINDNAVDQITLALPSEEGSAFENLARERAYPRIYRTTRVERAYLGAMELEDIEPDILVSVVELYDALLTDLEYANEQVLSATKRWESQEEIERMNRFRSRMSGGESERAESPIRKAEEGRSKVEENYLEQLRLLLTEAQIEELGGLKKREPREDRGRGDRGGSRQGGFSGDREAFMQRFDKDGNGEISESEREAIREHFRNGGGPPGRGGTDGGSRGSGNSGGGGQAPR
jgi:hypothetical protein